ncbi:MAG: hypothetical protein JNL70_26765 [Saprospiraceae bacterium]|nr:hypothetical protein [Saprospiraceae bacterium]
MLKKLTLTLLLGFAFHSLFAQKKEATNKNFTNELGLNVTNLLTDLLGNNNRTDAGQYLLSYKKELKDNKYLRLGATVNFSLSNQNTQFFSTELRNQNFQFRIGRETRQELSKRLQYYYGLDGIIGYKAEESVGVTSTSQIKQTDKNFIVGGGPLLGFQFALYERLLIGTEGSFYVAYNVSSTDFDQLSIGGGSSVIPPKKSTGINAQTNLPKFLFLILKF